MKNGWYKLLKEKEFNEKMVYVSNNIIMATKNDLGGEVEDKEIAITPDMEKKMAILEFDGLGIA